jgi:predicted nucleic acid-binding protein
VVESYVVDASVVAKWFNRGEENETEAWALNDAYVDDRVSLNAPNLLFFEVANAIWKNPGTRTKMTSSLRIIMSESSTDCLLSSSILEKRSPKKPCC